MRGNYWAKTTENGLPGCSVEEHCRSAAEVAKLLIGQLPESILNMLPDGISTLIGCHDVGKISPGFQTKCAAWRGPDGNATEAELFRWRRDYESNHALTSQWLILKYYKEQYGVVKGARSWSRCVGAHHGQYIQNKRTTEGQVPNEWKSDAFELIQRMEQLYGELPKGEIGEAKEIIIGLMIVADWIASDEHFFTAEGDGVESCGIRAEHAMQQLAFSSGTELLRNLNWGQLFPHAPSPRPLQQYLWEKCREPGIYIIEDAMGGGKTEAALGLAYHLITDQQAQGIYFALPTQTTSNRIFFRMLDFLQKAGAEAGPHNLRLAHGNSWLLRDSLFCKEGEEYQTSSHRDGTMLYRWFASAKRSLLTRYGVGTVDQALLGVLSVKHNFVRSYGLTGKVVILDEVHSYDVYTGSLVSILIRKLREWGATVIVLSATLTQGRLRELLGSDADMPNSSLYPLISIRTEQGIKTASFAATGNKEIQIECSESQAEDAAAEAYEHASAGQCVLWICNTVKSAQNAYRLLQAERCEGGPEIGLLHARFPYWRREELENEWIDRLGKGDAKRPEGCVLVATQVVEQSIDIDADYLITELAPTDMLLQRIGRLWRHSRPLCRRHAEMPKVKILSPIGMEEAHATQNSMIQFQKAIGASAFVYHPYVLWRTLQIWQKPGSIRLPGDIRNLIEGTYAEEVEEKLPLDDKMLEDLKHRREKMVTRAEMNCSPQAGTASDAEEEITTRYDTQQGQSVLLLRCKPEVLGAEEIRYTPLYGDPIIVNPNRWQFHVAKRIAENLVQVPAGFVNKDAYDKCLENFSFRHIFSYFYLDCGRFICYKAEKRALHWNEMIGVEAAEYVTEPDNDL